MGVRRTDFVVLGANIGKDKYDDDRFEEFEEYMENGNIGEMTYLIDGYSGEYFIVGKVLAADTTGEVGVHFSSHELNGNVKVFDYVDEVRDFTMSKFGIDIDPSIIAITHWT